MKQTIQAITLASLVGCSDYELHHNVQENGVSDQDINSSDTGSVPLETYDPCDPVDVGWDINPAGNERSDCVGIEGYAEPYAGALLTQISYGDCDVKGQPYSRVYEPDGSNYTANNIILGGGQSWYCPGDFYVYGWADYSGDDSNALSELSLEAKVWMLNSEERDSLRMLSEQEEEEVLYSIHEPLTYALECDHDAISLDEDCVAFLY